MIQVSILISTYGDRVSNLTNVILPFDERVRYFVAHQGCTPDCDISFFSQRNDVKYFKLSSVGVTKSRNFLLQQAALEECGDVFYFCDDDVTLNSKLPDILIDSHKSNSSAVITFAIEDESGKVRKKFPSVDGVIERNRFNILSVGTIEISLKRAYAHGLYFPENMGAGSKIPIGDEAVFLSKVLDNNLKISFIPQVIASHPSESSGVSVSKSTIYSRGVTIRNVFKWYGFFLLVPFFLLRIKLFKSKKYSLVSSFLIFTKGFFLWR